MRGDILLFRANPHSLVSRLIAWRTGGIFSHTAVDLGDGTMVEAVSEGVCRDAVRYERSVAIPLAAYTDAERIEAGIKWLLERVQEHAGYSYQDILNHLFFFRKLHIILAGEGDFDCSNLVARYLDITGGIDLGTLANNPDVVSPNDIFRAWQASKK